jgi:hypothetical protein
MCDDTMDAWMYKRVLRVGFARGGEGGELSVYHLHLHTHHVSPRFFFFFSPTNTRRLFFRSYLPPFSGELEPGAQQICGRFGALIEMNMDGIFLALEVICCLPFFCFFYSLPALARCIFDGAGMGWGWDGMRVEGWTSVSSSSAIRQGFDEREGRSEEWKKNERMKENGLMRV